MARLLLSFLSLCPFVLIAGEVLVKRGDILTQVTFEAQVMPAQVIPLMVSPKGWTDFSITSVLPHGAEVKKGAPLLTFQREEYELKCAEVAREVSEKEYALSLCQEELATLEKVTALKRAKQAEKEQRRVADHSYFKETQYAELMGQFQQVLKSAAWNKKNAEEELKQLRAMYEEDDLTEETEEIILERTAYAAEAAQKRYDSAVIEHARITEVTLPRRLHDRGEALKEAQLDSLSTLRSLADALIKKKKSCESLEREWKALQKKYEELREDAALFTLEAPQDGTFLYGVITHGKWEGATSSAKFMRVKGKPALHKPFACLIPQGGEQRIVAHIKGGTASVVKAGLTGMFTVEGLHHSPYAVTCQQRSPLPLMSGKFYTELTYLSEDKLPLTTTGKVALLLAERKNTLTLTKKALHYHPNGTVYTMVPRQATPADEGTAPALPEKRLIELGIVGAEMVEVLSGLEEGETVFTP